jgi:hypothetical protein
MALASNTIGMNNRAQGTKTRSGMNMVWGVAADLGSNVISGAIVALGNSTSLGARTLSIATPLLSPSSFTIPGANLRILKLMTWMAALVLSQVPLLYRRPA